MKERKLETYIRIRMYKSQKESWKALAKQMNTTITDLVINSVENNLTKGERKEILSFIEKQSNIFAKIENNINQFARIVNIEKSVSDNLLDNFNQHLAIISNLKADQNNLFKRIIRLLSK